VPTVPLDKELVAMVTAVPVRVALIVTASDFVAVVLLLSVTLKVIGVAVQVAVGVPEIVPVELRVKPAGNVPEPIDQV